MFIFSFLLPCTFAFAPSSTAPHKFQVNAFVQGPSLETKPDYENIHGVLGKEIDTVFLKVFRGKMADAFGFDSQLPYNEYQGLMELTAAMNARYSDKAETQRLAQEVLRSCFPSWLPSSYAILFSKPFPTFSSRMNAWATWVAGVWLMGECEINDVEVDGGVDGTGHGLLVKRCRFLEESGCASVCVNSCKIPTQNFFLQDMGLPLTMTPNYETYECQFAFGLTPSLEHEIEAKNTPCLSRCPTAGGLRALHAKPGIKNPTTGSSGQCSLMENPEPIELTVKNQEA